MKKVSLLIILTTLLGSALYLHEDLSTVTAAVTRNQMVRFVVLKRKYDYGICKIQNLQMTEWPGSGRMG